MARFLITGGTGFIGTQLVNSLVAAGHEATVYTGHPDTHKGKHGNQVRYIASFGDIDRSTDFSAVINLGGEGIADKRWSDRRKQELLDSRIGLTNHLVKCLAKLETRPEVMISGSAVGWYGASDATPLDENAGFHPEFAHELCQAWEDAASAVRELGVRLCITRLGVVLGKGGGMLKRMLPPYYIGLGGRIGSGRQYMTWVHREDVINAFNFLVDNRHLEGVFNLAAPDAMPNAEFTRAIGHALSRPARLPVPGFMVKLVFGEMGDRLLLHGQNAVPKRLQDAGFTFAFPQLEAALADILER